MGSRRRARIDRTARVNIEPRIPELERARELLLEAFNTVEREVPEPSRRINIMQMEAAVDYVIMLAMRMQQDEGACDKDAFATILDMLQKFEGILQSMRAGNIDEMLSARIQAESQEWMRNFSVIIAVVLAVVMALILILTWLLGLNIPPEE